MYNLLRFIRLNHFLLLFILIESFSVFLLINNNSYQANKALEFSVQYTSSIYNTTSYFSNYIALKETNDYLVKENAKLYSLLNNNKNYQDSNIIINKKFSYIAAKVINNSVNKRNNFITLNQGSKSGIKNGMGVITPSGVIGVVHTVSKNYALVLSILHHKSATGIFLKKNMHTGIMRWNGFDYKVTNINDLPEHITINKGDTIITNSYSNIYPEAINIGTINDFNKNNDGFYNINVNLFEDFNKLRYVYVVNSKESKEQQILEKVIHQND